MEYDTNLKQPICLPINCTNPIECKSSITSSISCGLEHLVEVISTSPPSKSIQIQRIPSIEHNNEIHASNVTCSAIGNNLTTSFDCIDSKNYARFMSFCIPNYMIRDYINYKQFKVNTVETTAAATVTNDLFENMEFLIFLCQTMKMFEYCEHVANLCVLTVYNLDKFSPCNLFYTTQTTLISSGTDSYQTKLIPFLFFAKGRSVSDDLDKIIDFRYKYTKNNMDYDRDDYNIFGHYSVSMKLQSKNRKTIFIPFDCYFL